MTHLTPVDTTHATEGRLVPEERAPIRLLSLKDQDSFLIADAYGDIFGDGDGFFLNDTRILSEYRLTLGGMRPALLSATVSRDNVAAVSHLTNRKLIADDGSVIGQGAFHIERNRILCGERCYELIACRNYSDMPLTAPIGIRFASDFRDMFEIRGETRPRRGTLHPVEASGSGVVLRYDGLDGVLRQATISFSETPAKLAAGRADFQLSLAARGATELYIEIGADGPERPTRERYRHAVAKARQSMRDRTRRRARLATGDELFDACIKQSRADLALLTTDLPTGPYPYAGIPWFSTPFGRDAVITALETLWLDSTLARGVLAYLAKYQAHETSLFRDSAPGKIMHETRKGEMTALNELPFARYYGGVDTTPLFIMLAGAYADRTGDLRFIEELWPNLELAMSWIESVCDSNPDGFLVYARGEKTGLANQGWKDSENSIFHADGRFPEGPIALVEVQGYVFAALKAMAALAERRGDGDAAARWQSRAQTLQQRVEERFWMDDKEFYGIAIDGQGKLARVCASNAGHLLFVGLSQGERAARVTQRFLSGEFNSGWGIRTLAGDQVHFNPMSYHNGSIWPHDTALCAAGMARYGERDGVVALTQQIFEAGAAFDMRLPELYCGFTRKNGEKPINYPVACLPQAWSAGSIFLMIQAWLGIEIDGWKGQIRLDRPVLPATVDRLTVNNLVVGPSRVDLRVERRNGSTYATLGGPDAERVSLVASHSAASETRPS